MPIEEYKCPNCGGAITFDSTSQSMKCPYCDSEFEIEAVKEFNEVVQEESLDPQEMKWETPAGSEWKQSETDGLAVFVCKSCAGEIVADETLGSTSCPYCGNPIVLSHQFSDALRPDYVIPFKKDKEAAKEGLRQHIKGKILLPKQFKDENYINEIKGLYVPFWLFNSDVDATIRYKGTKVRTWSDSNYNYTETSHYSILRSGKVGFERIAIDGSSKMEDALMESINPFNFNDAVDFQTAYLAGYLADKYDVTAEDSVTRANERIKKSTEEIFRSTVHGYQSTMVENSNVRLSNGSASYALYPVWVLTTTYQDKQYMFAMNGQTGKFVGNLPLDKGLAVKWTIGLTIIFSIVSLFVGLVAF